MRLLTAQDFKSTGWDVGDKVIGALVNGIISTQKSVFAKYDITQDLHIVHFMAQISHESGEGEEMTE